MTEVRPATARDAAELMRLRAVMLTEVRGTAPEPGPWQSNGTALLAEKLGTSLVAFVVDDDEHDGLAACVVGMIDQRLPGPHNPSGLTGYVFSVATDPSRRRRGYSRACMQALLGWFEERSITSIDLRASTAGEPLYTSLGFRHTRDPGMRRAPR